MLKIFVDGIDGNFERKSIHILAPNQEQAEQLRKMQLLRMAYSINKLVKALRQNRTTRLDSYTISIHCKMSHNRFFAIGFF
jgi:intein-encoded DNA endonuclease-like protein